jgi:hypothetical protein
MTDCPQPNPCDLQEFKVTASSSYPESKVEWEMRLPLEEHLYYTNVTYDLIAMLIARIGIVFTKSELENEDPKEALAEIRRVLNVGMFD